MHTISRAPFKVPRKGSLPTVLQVGGGGGGLQGPVVIGGVGVRSSSVTWRSGGGGLLFRSASFILCYFMLFYSDRFVFR